MKGTNNSSMSAQTNNVHKIGNRNQEQYLERPKASDEPGKITWSPWLLIRYSDNDLGLRPVPSGNSFWSSPDIWVESSDIYGRPVVGEENFVHARILNLGMAGAAPVKVDFYWADPSLAFEPANMNLIGTEWVEIISQGVLDVRCNTPWIPIFLNQGHECLVVNCSNWIADPVIHPFQAWNDRHVGQRNVTVIEAFNGQIVNFRLMINNVLPIRTLTKIYGRIEHVTVTDSSETKSEHRNILDKVVSYGTGEFDTSAEMIKRFDSCTSEYLIAKRIARVASSAQQEKSNLNRYISRVSKNSRDNARIASRITDSSFIVKPNKPGTFFANLLLARDKMSSRIPYLRQDEIILLRSWLEPFEQREVILELKVPDSAKIGEYLAFHISQWAQEFVLGGYCLLIKIVSQINNKKEA